MTDVIFSFDTEDYVDRAGADAILRAAELLRAENVRGCFNIVGRLAEALPAWGRQDVIDALGYHEIESHTLAHSFHPTVNEYTDLEDFAQAKAFFLERETQCLDILRRTFGKERVYAFCPPGNSVSYVGHYGYAELGVPVYDGDLLIDAVRGRPVSFCNMLSLNYDYCMEEYFIPGENRPPVTDQALQELLDDIAGKKDLFVFYHHPHMSMYTTHWDEVNFRGKNTPPAQWKSPQRLPEEATEQFFSTLARLVRMIKADPRFRVVTYETIGREYGGPRRLTRDMLPGIKAQLEQKFFPVTLPQSFCLSDLFAACRAFLLGGTSHDCGTVYGFLEEPFAVSAPVAVTGEAMRQSAATLPEDGFLPLSIPVGEQKLGPADWLRAALEILCGADCAAVCPGPWQIDLDQFPALKDMHLEKSWINTEWEEDRHVSRRARLQSWTIRLPQGSFRTIF